VTHDLAVASGLPVSLEDEAARPQESARRGGASRVAACRLLFAPPLSAIEPATRPADRLRQVYRDPAAVGRSAAQGFYFMYDGVALPQHRAAIARAGLRYDLTLLRHAVVGDEPVKTLGHYHDVAPAGVPYPELYEVVFGIACFVLQLAHAPAYRVQRIVVVEARAGEAVLMPPGWGHVSINAGDTPLVMCNWIADACRTVPEPYLERRGAACYAVRSRAGLTLAPNPNYDAPYPCAVNRAGAAAPALLSTGPIYTHGVDHLDALRPLIEPTRCDWPAEPWPTALPRQLPTGTIIPPGNVRG
jgi:glucose-6-phosphate isomerase